MKFKAALKHPKNEKKMYFFNEDEYYRYNIDADVLDSGYPKNISSNWDGLPSNIDAAINHPSNPDKMYFFKGDEYYRFDFGDNKIDNGYPYNIGQYWDGLPSNIDAAMNHPYKKNKIYFFKGSQYWRYDFENDTIDSGYPKNISYWPGIPDNIDAIVNHPARASKIYFFKGDKYYRYDFSEDKTDSGYPKNTEALWTFTEEGLFDKIKRYQKESSAPYILREYVEAKSCLKRCEICKNKMDLNYKRATVLLRISGHNVQEISKAIVKVYRKVKIPLNIVGMDDLEVDLINSPSLIAETLKLAGYSTDDVVDGVLDVFDLAPDPLYSALSYAGIDEEDVKGVFNDMGEEFADFADDVGDTLSDGVDYLNPLNW